MILKHLSKYYQKKHEIFDLGTNSLDSVDYPIMGNSISKEILSKKYDFGIAICGTGIGISIACNRHIGIRAALVTSKKMAFYSKNHNNANIICLGGRTTCIFLAICVINTFIKTKFSSLEKHRIRNNMLDASFASLDQI